MTIGILAVQGAFIEHEKMLSKLSAKCFEIRKADDLNSKMDGLIIPGGESTVQGKLLRELGIFEPLRQRISAGLPVFGTCAGLILLAKNVENDERRCFSTMDITALRNGYGRQLGSFHTISEFSGIGKIPMTFIRAPYISEVKDNVEILAQVNGKIVAARQDNQLVTAFHPELTEDLRVHEYFLSMIKNVG